MIKDQMLSFVFWFLYSIESFQFLIIVKSHTHSDHLAFLASHARNKTRKLVQAILELHLRSRGQQIKPAPFIRFKRGLREKKEGLR